MSAMLRDEAMSKKSNAPSSLSVLDSAAAKAELRMRLDRVMGRHHTRRPLLPSASLVPPSLLVRCFLRW